MWPVLQALKELDGSGTNREIDEKVIEIEGFTDEQQAVMHKNDRHTLVEYRLLWARSVLKRVGAVDNSTRGVWAITEKGRALTPLDVAQIPGEYKKLLGAERAAKKGGADEDPDQEAQTVVGFPIYFQCKKWAKGVGPKEVRDFRGAMSGRGETGLADSDRHLHF